MSSAELAQRVVKVNTNSSSIQLSYLLWNTGTDRLENIDPDQMPQNAEYCCWQHSFMEIDHEIVSMVIFSLHLIQEGQMSVSWKRMRTSPAF